MESLIVYEILLNDGFIGLNLYMMYKSKYKNLVIVNVPD